MIKVKKSIPCPTSRRLSSLAGRENDLFQSPGAGEIIEFNCGFIRSAETVNPVADIVTKTVSAVPEKGRHWRFETADDY